MADDTKQSKNQKDAQDKNAIPEQVQVSGNEPAEEAQKYQEQNKQVKDALAKYGQVDLEQFIGKIGSDSVYARQVVMDMLGVKQDQPLVLGSVAGSPQEHNLTGVLDHSEFPAKLKEAQDASVPDATPEKVG